MNVDNKCAVADRWTRKWTNIIRDNARKARGRAQRGSSVSWLKDSEVPYVQDRFWHTCSIAVQVSAAQTLQRAVAVEETTTHGPRVMDWLEISSAQRDIFSVALLSRKTRMDAGTFKQGGGTTRRLHQLMQVRITDGRLITAYISSVMCGMIISTLVTFPA